jgi:hypothetical protein
VASSAFLGWAACEERQAGGTVVVQGELWSRTTDLDCVASMEKVVAMQVSEPWGE